MTRTRLSVLLVTGALVAGLLPLAAGSAATAAPASTAVASALPASTAAAAPEPAAGGVRVGELVLQPCDVLARALCGSLPRAWDPTGAVPGTVSVGFAYVPARDTTRPARGTFVPREGGPGYATTASADGYAQMYGKLLRRNNMLLVDQRGTGRTAAIDCPELQDLEGAYAPAAATCAQRLGPRAHLYGTALSADDLAAVVRALELGRVDVYGDSYGTFFAQVYAGRHPGQVRSLVVDSAYPTYGENAWYPTQAPAMRHAFDLVCARTPRCAARRGSTVDRLTRVVRQVRQAPVTGRAPGADRAHHRVRIDPSTLAYVAFSATYVPTAYRELDAALRAMLQGRPRALLRLVAEAFYPGGGIDDPVDYSEGADAAVSCTDYPQLYDMTAPPAQRAVQYRRAIAARSRTHPRTYAPFRVREYLASDWEMQSWCQSWPAAPAPYRQGPVVPPEPYSARVPVLVLSGELDSITTAAEGRMVARQWPRSTHVVVANSFHVTAVGDTDDCAVRIVRAFVRHPRRALPGRLTDCARQVPPVRATPAFRTSYRVAPAAAALGAGTTGTRRLRAVTTAAETVADVLDRWYQTYESAGLGLHGGTFRIRGYDTVRFRLHRVRLVPDLAVSGTVRWDRYGHTVTVRLRLHGGARVSGRLTGSWDTRAAGAYAVLTGRLGGQPVRAGLPAP